MIEEQPQHAGNSFFRSLTFKVGFLAACIMLVVLIALSAVFVLFERQNAHEQLLENGRRFATFSADGIYDDYVRFYTQPLPEDFNNFRQRLNEKLAANKDITSVSLVASNGRILFDTTEFKSGRYTGPARIIKAPQTLNALANNDVSATDRDIDGKKVSEIIVPLTEPSGGHVLSMRYLLSYASLVEQTGRILQRTFAVAILLMILVVLMVILFARRLTSPVIQLTRVTEQIRLGNFALKASEGSADEIGRLGRAVNSMAASLKSYYLDLEAKVRDRTRELEAAKEQLLGNVRQDEALLASIGDGVIATDHDGNVLWINAAAEDMLKASHKDVVGKPYDTIWRLETERGEELTDEQQPFSQAIETGQTVRNSDYYYARKNPDGSPLVRFAVALTIAPVSLNDRIIGVVSVFRDVTHERQVDRMKTEFISLASHQLRTPLSAIRWFTEMLMSGDAGKLNSEQGEFAKNIYDSVDRMIDLVNSLLNISRIESGRIIVEPKPTDLNELVTGVVNDLKAKTEQKQQTLIVSVHKDMPKVNLDPHLIGQVYMNFLTNAIKYTPKGGEISVFVSRKDDELVSQITDNGYGIPKEQHARVFQKFFRAENIVKVETDGTGLGLYLVKAIIESSGGRVWFDSEEGKGTTFWFTLPMSGMKAREGEVTLDA